MTKMLSKPEILSFHKLMDAFQFTWSDMQRMLIELAMIRHNGNKTRVARELDISVRTVRLKMKKYAQSDIESDAH